MSIAIVDHALPYDTHNLYDVTFYTHNIQTLLTSSPSMVDSWLSETRNLHSLPQSLIVGFDVEWRPNFQRNMQNPVAILQLCVGARCLIFQILHSPNIPQSLINFLGNANHTFVGVGIEEDVEKLVDDYELSVATFVDLRDLAVDKLGDNELKKSGLKTLARRVLEKEIEKPKNISRSRWDNPWLTPEQVKSRMMGDSTYKSTLDCFVKTLKNDGPLAFYKGFIPNFGRLGSWNVIMFLTLEQVVKKVESS